MQSVFHTTVVKAYNVQNTQKLDGSPWMLTYTYKHTHTLFSVALGLGILPSASNTQDISLPFSTTSKGPQSEEDTGTSNKCSL